MRIKSLIALFIFIHAIPATSQDFYGHLSDKTEKDNPRIRYGEKYLTLGQKSVNLVPAAGRSEVQHEASELPGLSIGDIELSFSDLHHRINYASDHFLNSENRSMVFLEQPAIILI
jgi:hypothetical protein